jgi:hypothetical protein
MVQRITQAPPPRLTYSSLVSGYERPVFPLRLELFTFGSFEALAFAATALGSFLLAPALLTLPFAAPAFLGLAASGAAIGTTAPEVSTGWVGLGGTGNGSCNDSCNDSCRTCAGCSRVRATPSPRRPAPDGSVVTTPSGSPSSFQASAASSSPSLSLSSPSPAMIASAIRPAFWRTAASILPATSGFSLRNCLAFSRP